MKVRTASRITAFSLLFGLCLGTTRGHAAPLKQELEDATVFGGTPVQGCGWPSTVSLGTCSGTLIHPKVVLTAAHCQPEQRLPFVHFTQDMNGDQIISKRVTECHSFPGFFGNFGDGVDWAFCILAEEVHDVPIVPVMTECEYAQWSRYALHDEIVLVGFGLDEHGGAGVKRKVRVPVAEILGDEIKVGGDGKAGCFGDSGGPAFVQLPDKTWRVAGIISYALGACGSHEYLASVAASVGWLNRELAQRGIDVTPCTDRQGVWVGGPYCADFPVQPHAEQCDLPRARGGRTQSCTSSFHPDGHPAKNLDFAKMAPQSPNSKSDAGMDHGLPQNGEPGHAPLDAAAKDEHKGFDLGCQLTPRPSLGWWMVGLLGLAIRRTKRR